MKTVKATETKSISARELFSLTYGTRELYTQEKISSLKKKVKLKTANAEFFESDGVVFFASLIEGSGDNKGHHLTMINFINDFSYSMSSKKELWRFGFVNRKTGEITLLFGGQCVANGRNEAFHFYEIAKVVTNKKFENHADLVAFAHKD